MLHASEEGFFSCHSEQCPFMGPALMLHEHLNVHKDIVSSVCTAFSAPSLTSLLQLISVALPDIAFTGKRAAPAITPGASVARAAQATLAPTDSPTASSPGNPHALVPINTPAEVTSVHSSRARTSQSFWGLTDGRSPIFPVASTLGQGSSVPSSLAHTSQSSSGLANGSSTIFSIASTPEIASSTPSSLAHTSQNSGFTYGTSIAFSAASTPGLDSPTPAFPGSYISSIRVSTQLPPVAERLSKAAAFIHHFSGVCVFHFLTNAPVLVDHQSFNDCDYGFGMGSHYQRWRKSINFRASACYVCGCPYKSPVFEHDSRIGKLCPHKDWQEFVRPLAYTVFHVPAMREAVFDHLGIEHGAFLSSDDYGKWLGHRSGGMDKVSNLIEIVYAVAELRDMALFPESSVFEVSSVLPLQRRPDYLTYQRQIPEDLE